MGVLWVHYISVASNDVKWECWIYNDVIEVIWSSTFDVRNHSSVSNVPVTAIVYISCVFIIVYILPLALTLSGSGYAVLCMIC